MEGPFETRLRAASARRLIERKVKNVPTTSYGPSNLNLEVVAIGVEYPFRRCDYLASHLSDLEGSTRCDLFWPEASRDEAVAACMAYLKHFGASFTAHAAPGIHDVAGPKAHLRFPALRKPATAADVASRARRNSSDRAPTAGLRYGKGSTYHSGIRLREASVRS
jgi:hypothetical protein